MNPYDFVHIDWGKGVARGPAKPHDRFNGVSGHFEGAITALTPIFIQDSQRQSRPLLLRQFLTNRQGLHIIPGSSLKGLIRSLVETIGPGCWCLVGETHRDKLPDAFHPCHDLRKLCVACGMFGLVSGETHLKGHVGFDDAVCEEPVPHPAMYTPILDAPKPRHVAWYLDKQGKRVAGRKYYFHSTEVLTERQSLTSGRGVQLNQHIAPLAAGSAFTFRGHFDSLDQDDLSLLLYALVLEPGMRHKLGYAKPAGLGSVEIALTRLSVCDDGKRYTQTDRGSTSYEGQDLEKYIAQSVASRVNDVSSTTLQDLRRIWAWPPADVGYGYPTRTWFDANPGAPIEETLNAPRQ